MDINKFSLPEMLSNNNGKTSGSGTMGVLISTIGALCFGYGTIIKDSNIISQSLLFTTLGVGLLGYRKSRPDPIAEEVSKDEVVPENNPPAEEIVK